MRFGRFQQLFEKVCPTTSLLC